MATKKVNSVDKQIQRFESTQEGKKLVHELEAELQVAQQMADLIEKSGLSVREVARRMGTSASQLHRVLNFEVSTSVSTLTRFAAALGYSFQGIFTKHPADPQQALAADAVVSTCNLFKDLIKTLDSRFAKLESAVDSLQAKRDVEFVSNGAFNSGLRLSEPMNDDDECTGVPPEWKYD